MVTRIRVYRDASGGEHRVAPLDGPGFDPAHLPDVDTAAGETTVDLDRGMPDDAVERWDAALGAYVPRPARVRRRLFTRYGFMLCRFSLQQHDRYSRVLRGKSPVLDAGGNSRPLTDDEQDMADTLNRLLNAKEHIDPASNMAGAALGYCAALHVIEGAEIAAKHVAVTDAEFALGPEVAVEGEG